MSRTTLLGREARDELIEAALWYEERERGSGEGFSDAVLARIDTLNRFPNSGTPVRGVNGVLLARQVRLRRYPYLIVYVVSDNEIRVVAIAHERQSPGYWATRLAR